MNEVIDFEGWAGGLEPGCRPALLCIDLMGSYFLPGSPFYVGSRDCLDSAARVLASARSAGIPVAHTRVTFSGTEDAPVFLRKVPALTALIGDPPEAQIMPEVQPLADEPVLIKHYASAFFGTDLNEWLALRRIDTTIVVGVSTSGCVRATALDCLQNGFVPLVVREGVADRDGAAHAAALHDLQTKYAEVVTESQTCEYIARCN